MHDRATRAYIEKLEALGQKPLAESTVEEARYVDPKYLLKLGPGPEMGRVEMLAIPSGAGDISARLLVPQQGARGLLVFYHGGGWVIGTLDEYDALCRKIAERSSCAVAMVDHRLAPEHRYPAAVDDCYAATAWLAARVEEIARPGAPLIIGGDSAGGNLAAAVALRARERATPAIALQLLIYPVLDADLDRPSYLDPENQPLLTRADMAWFWDHYVPDPNRRLEPEASPLRAADLAGLPPAVVLTAEHDVLRDEGEAYAARLAEAGVPVDARRYAGQAHGFVGLTWLPGGELGLQHVVRAMRRCTAKPDRPIAAPQTVAGLAG